MRITTLAFAGAFVAASAAHAVEPVTMGQAGIAPMPQGRVPGPVQQTLESMASGKCSATECFDGAPVLRREPPVVILKENLIEHRPGYYHHRGGRLDDSQRWVWVEPTWTYRQKVGFDESRQEYIRQARTSGRVVGGFLGGFLGLLGFLGGPIVGGALILIGLLYGARIIGRNAEKCAETESRTYERIKVYNEKQS